MRNPRCKPGDLARVVRSTNPALIGRTVFVESQHDSERWAVTLLGAPAFGLTFGERLPVIGHKTAFRDASLVPLRGSEPKATEQVWEAPHA
jgi:hypothetical protein